MDIAIKAPPPGVVFAVEAAALFDASPPFAKLLVGEVSPLPLAGLPYLGSSVGLSLAQRQSTAGAGETSLPRSGVGGRARSSAAARLAPLYCLLVFESGGGL